MKPIQRRTLFGAGLATASGLLAAACTGKQGATDPYVTPDGDEVRAAEAKRNPGTVRELRLTAVAGHVDLGGPTVETWSYGAIPGTQLRVKAGEVVRATLTNDLPDHTSIHWHGLALRNDADGVPDLTQRPIPAGSTYTYEFTAAHAGTYWFHPHSAVQLDRGLYAPFVVEDPNEPLAYDDEWVVVLDDWLDGIDGRAPDAQLAELRKGMSGMSGMNDMGGMSMGVGSSYLLGGDAGDVNYPHFLLNGRVPASPATHQAKPGTRLRLRIVNAGGDTAFRVALGGHRLLVTHSDGFPVEPLDVATLLVGMGERYDVVVTLGDGVFPLVALAEGKNATALGLIRTGAGQVPPATARPAELDGKLAEYRNLKPTEAVRLPARAPDRTIELKLTGDMTRYDWAFNGKAYDPKHIEALRAGERVRINFVNTTQMWHPVHLHGHTFAVGETGVRKDTAIVLPKKTLTVDFDADNPGLWMVHCHNIYHAEAGMMTVLGYLK